MKERSKDPTENIEGYEPAMPESILYIIAEYPEEQHINAYMQGTGCTVQEHRREYGPYITPSGIEEKPFGHQAKGVKEINKSIGRTEGEKKLQEPYGNVDTY
jgi:hypothetical protein